MNNDTIRSGIDSAVREIGAALPNVSNLSIEASRRVLSRYSASITPNFVFWMAGAMLFARSPDAQLILAENLRIEIRDDHPALLQAFTDSSGIMLDEVNIVSTTAFAGMCHRSDGLSLIAVIAVMESASAVFIPFLAELSRNCGGTDFRYTDIHGAADILHAEDCIRALQCEAMCYHDAESRMNIALGEVVRFWKAIFTE